MVFRVLVGLPSFNEADTIATVATEVDAALATLPFAAEALLVNADNASADSTPHAFLATPTRAPKHTVTTSPAGGKGSNVHALLRFACEDDFDAVLLVDTDLAAVPSRWVHSLLGAVRDGVEVCYPLRPPTWNGGDLTYQLAYPVLAGVFGVDLREPLCGELALSRAAAERALQGSWTAAERGYGVDFRIASIAVAHAWSTVTLPQRRRNKLRSFTAAPNQDYRMGGKFTQVARAVRRHAARRLQQPPPDELIPSPTPTPADDQFVVPGTDPDIARLAAATSRRLLADAHGGAFEVFPTDLAEELAHHAMSPRVAQGLGWPEWRDCLIAWIHDHDAPAIRAIPTALLETLFLNRVVGHHTEIAGTSGWYASVRQQALDLFAHRHALWVNR